MLTPSIKDSATCYADPGTGGETAMEEEATCLGSEIGQWKKSQEGNLGLAAGGKVARETRLNPGGRRDRYYSHDAVRGF